jgi:hypothetical protein
MIFDIDADGNLSDRSEKTPLKLPD